MIFRGENSVHSSSTRIRPIDQLDFFPTSQTVPVVSRLVKLVSLLLIAVWLPATLHCHLEALGLDALFACPVQIADAGHTDNDTCADDGCQTVEAGQFVFSKSRIAPAALPSPDACLAVHCLLQVAPPSPVLQIFASPQTETLPLQRTWQFARRAALPARAPDVLNT